MPICEVTRVKKVLRLPLNDKSNVSELRRCLADACEMAIILLNAQGLTMPKVVPLVIVDSVKYFAAWEFQCKRKAVKAADVLWQEAVRLLCSYVDKFCYRADFFQII